MNCKCTNWASEDVRENLLGNGHHSGCPKFERNVGAIELLKQLVAGINYWASQEDGVPDELWEAYRKAVWITEGRMIPDDPERHPVVAKPQTGGKT